MDILTTVGQVVANALQIVFVLAGVMLAFAGRYVDDGFIYLVGCLAGAIAGLVAAEHVAGFANAGLVVYLVASALLLFAGGLFGAALAWRAYLPAFYLTGAVLAYFSLTALAGVGPLAALPGIVVALVGVARLVSLVALLGFLGGGLGVLVFLWGVAVVTDHPRLVGLFRRAGWAEELGMGRVYVRSVTVVPPVALVALGALAVAVQVGVWAHPATRHIVLDGLRDLSVLLPDVATYLVVFTGSVLAGAVGWWLQRVALAVYMAAVGAVLVTVAPSPVEFLGALAALRLTDALGLVDSLSVLFLAVLVAGTAIQLGSDAVGSAADTGSR